MSELKENKYALVILTGAGVSAESGIKTFRASDGLWENHPVDEVATPEGFARDPDLVHKFYNNRRQDLGKVQPNAAHIALGDLEKKLQDKLFLVTQNIDDLHERGGANQVAHMHGELYKIFCSSCGAKFERKEDLSKEEGCPACSMIGSLRPDIVWFGEMPYRMEEINDALSNCDVFVAIGTSGNVFPAAGFVLQARMAGALCCEINLEPSMVQQYFDHGYYGQATEQVELFIKDLTKGKLRKSTEVEA